MRVISALVHEANRVAHGNFIRGRANEFIKAQDNGKQHPQKEREIFYVNRLPLLVKTFQMMTSPAVFSTFFIVVLIVYKLD